MLLKNKRYVKGVEKFPAILSKENIGIYLIGTCSGMFMRMTDIFIISYISAFENKLHDFHHLIG